MTNHYDIIIIGTGSGGSTMAYKLASSGKRILILERGGFIPKEKENWDPHEVVNQGRYRPDDVWYDQDDKPFKPFIHYNVGGNSKMYGAALFRFRESEKGNRLTAGLPFSAFFSRPDAIRYQRPIRVTARVVSRA